MTSATELVSIRVVEKETGLSKDVLRVWERRYGFPMPERTEAGERLYSRSQIERLLSVKKLIDSGMRPGKIVRLEVDELAKIAGRAFTNSDVPHFPADDIAVAMDMLANHSTQLRDFFLNRLATMGTRRFITDFVAPMNHSVGEAWLTGRIQVFAEHYYSNQIQSVLTAAFSLARIEPQSPRVVLATIHGELHVLGLHMVELMLTLEGATCIPLGAQVPLHEIVRSAEFYSADIVALSFSSHYPLKDAKLVLNKLAADLPQKTEIWAGGGLVHELELTARNVRLFSNLDHIPQALRVQRNAISRCSSKVRCAV